MSIAAKKIYYPRWCDTESRNSTRKRSNFVKSHYSVISRNWTSVGLLFVEFLDSVSATTWIFFFSAAIDNGDEIFYTSKLYTFPGRMLLIRKDSIKKVSKRLSYFFVPPKKCGPKVAHFYCGKAYRDWPQIQDRQILTVGNPIESKDMRLWGQLFFRGRRSKRIVLILSLRLFSSDQKRSSRNYIKLADVEYRVLKVDSRGEKKLGWWHRIKEFYTNEVEFREITLQRASPYPDGPTRVSCAELSMSWHLPTLL